MAVDMRKTLEYVEVQIANLTTVRDGLRNLLNTAGTLPVNGDALRTLRTPLAKNPKAVAAGRAGANARWGKTKRRKVQMSPKGSTWAAVEKAYQRNGGQPMEFGELYDAATKAGWTTHSTNPKNNFGALVRGMVLAGKLRKVGTDYELVTRGAEQEIPITEQVTGEIAQETNVQSA